jgi:hypothetical protein
VFHFNKGHLADETIPMWVIKTHGESFYVNHVSAEIAWSTKETPDNAHTKGSIKFKECLLTINPENEATISKLTLIDKVRLRNQKLGITRIMFSWGSGMHKALSNNEFKHSPFKNVEGACGSSFIICDLLKKEEVVMAGLKYTRDWRILKPNESYYQAYDQKGTIWEDDVIDDDDE